MCDLATVQTKVRQLVEANALQNTKVTQLQGKLVLKSKKEAVAVKFPSKDKLNDDWWKSFNAALSEYASSGKVDGKVLEATNMTTKLTLGLTGKIRAERLNINYVHKRFCQAKKRLLCLDYDGTLRKFEATPPEAFPSEATLKMLSDLAAKPNTTVAIISGRDSRDLDGWFKDPNLYLIGDHGTRIKQGGEWSSLITYKIENREKLFNDFEAFFNSYDSGFIYEKKETSFGCNLRSIKPETNAKIGEITKLLEEKWKTELEKNALKVQVGVSDIEILNRGNVNKGEGIRKMLTKDDYDFVFVAGDAWTDEDMFKAAPANAITIKLGVPVDPKDQTKQTYANYYLDVEDADPDNGKKVAQMATLMNKLAAKPFDAVIFDLDGVLTQTASTHSSAWGATFNEYLKKRSAKDGKTYPLFEHEKDYLPYVDGKARYVGVQSFMESRGITDLPYGDPSDGPEKETICGVGNTKNILFNKKVEEEGVEFYKSTIDFIHDLRKRGVRIGCASSSKNCIQILKKLGLLELFETIVDGNKSATLKLRSKPEGDIFTTAADEMKVSYDRCVCVEDATSGVEAGKRGGFGLVLGIARHGNHTDLELNGADIVVSDMAETNFDEIVRWFEGGSQDFSWHINYNQYSDVQEGVRQNLCAVGNGYTCSLHCCEEAKADKIHYPGVYIASLFNTLPSQVGNKTLYNEDFVCCPNWGICYFQIGDNAPFNFTNAEKVSYNRWLDMYEGVACREIVVRDAKGNETRVSSRRVVNLDSPHEMAQRYEITPLNYSDKITVFWGIDGEIINDQVPRYSTLNQKQLDQVSAAQEGDMCSVVVKTTTSNVTVAEAVRARVQNGGEDVSLCKVQTKTTKGSVLCSVETQGVYRQPIVLTKVATIYRSTDEGVKDPLASATEHVKKMSGWGDVYRRNIAAWKDIWSKIDILLVGDRIVQRLLRLHMFHLIVSGSPHSTAIDYSIGARGLHGEAYRGHVFWDEIYIFPFYSMHIKEVTRSFLMYRYRRLGEAKKLSKEDENCAGAMYPWQSGSTGKEETQVLHLNPKSGLWDPDLSRRQRHVNLAIQYNIWQYYHMTLDTDFLANYGLEVFLEICRFWASKANEEGGKYHIAGVMGPDEYHEKYPDADMHHGGFKDNAYTNLMCVWAFEMVQKLVKVITPAQKEALYKKINFDDKELQHFETIASKMNVCMNSDEILEQFDGFFKLRELDWEGMKKKYGGAKGIARLDRIMKAEGESCDDFQLAKQADTLMTFYNLKTEEVIETLHELGIEVKDKKNFLAKQFNYYYPRTSHGSTLSRVVHAALTNEMGLVRDSWDLYLEALTSDYIDIQGGTTKEGIHAGVMAGTVLMAQKFYLGLSLASEYVKVEPKLPEHWKAASMNFEFRKDHYDVDLNQNEVEITMNSQDFVWVQRVNM